MPTRHEQGYEYGDTSLDTNMHWHQLLQLLIVISFPFLTFQPQRLMPYPLGHAAKSDEQ